MRLVNGLDAEWVEILSRPPQDLTEADLKAIEEGRGAAYAQDRRADRTRAIASIEREARERKADEESRRRRVEQQPTPQPRRISAEDVYPETDLKTFARWFRDDTFSQEAIEEWLEKEAQAFCPVPAFIFRVLWTYVNAINEKNIWRNERLDALERHSVELRSRAAIDTERLTTLEGRPAGQSYRGVWQAGTAYHRGDTVTWGGSQWHANDTTRDKPGDGSKGWTLCVKKGADGKAADPQRLIDLERRISALEGGF